MPNGAAILSKALMPTTASSAEIRAAVSAQIRARSVFSARTPSMRYLAKLQQVLAEIARGTMNDATARTILRSFGKSIGYTPEGGFPGEKITPPAEAGSLQDLLSPSRLKVLLETPTRLARSARQQIDGSSEYALHAYPAWSLERVYSRRVARSDWMERWRAAGESVSWEGAAQPASGILGEPRMIALKDSPIWQAIGEGAGGYEDVIGTTMPPFAYGSGLGWVAVKREQAEALGLLAGGDPDAPKIDLSPAQQEWDALFDSIGEGGIRDLLKDLKGSPA